VLVASSSVTRLVIPSTRVLISFISCYHHNIPWISIWEYPSKYPENKVPAPLMYISWPMPDIIINLLKLLITSNQEEAHHIIKFIFNLTNGFVWMRSFNHYTVIFNFSFWTRTVLSQYVWDILVPQW
jgi:hypothetical protein